MEKSFYIVPSTKNYYDVVTSDIPENALASFVDDMDNDMSTYFKAVDKAPVKYPHGYEYPEGNFECALSIIMATVEGNKKSPYYCKDILKELELINMNAIGKLQEAYDMLYTADKKAALKSRGKFYKILKNITGFSFDKDAKPDPEAVERIFVGNMVDEACYKLSEADIPYDVDNGGRLLVKRQHLAKALTTLDNAGIKSECI